MQSAPKQPYHPLPMLGQSPELAPGEDEREFLCQARDPEMRLYLLLYLVNQVPPSLDALDL